MAPGAVSARVLVVDDELNLRFALERGLRKCGHFAESASTVRQALERLRAQSFDVVVCDLRMPGGDGVEVLQWLGSYSPSTKVVVLSAFITAEIRSTYANTAGIRLLEKPVELDELVLAVEDFGARRGFYGSSIEVELFDYVQMIALSGRDKLIDVTTPAGAGQIWFEHGDIVHAVYDGHRGEQAFYQLLAAGRGSFKETMFVEPDVRTVVGSSTHLLMEAARQMDEGILGAAPAPAHVEDETSFAELASGASDASLSSGQLESHAVDDLFVDDSRTSLAPSPPVPVPPPSPPPEASTSGLGLLDDPETRALMLGQFFQFEGVNGAAIVSSTGKVLAEDMRDNAALVTLAGFYMRGAARIARALGHNVFDSILARAGNGQQLLTVGMGATSAVLSIEIGCDLESVRDEIMGVEAGT